MVWYGTRDHVSFTVSQRYWTSVLVLSTTGIYIDVRVQYDKYEYMTVRSESEYVRVLLFRDCMQMQTEDRNMFVS